jgi:hypothetical protein
VGIIALLAGLGTALPPLGGVGWQETLRWWAMWVAFGAAFVELVFAGWVLVKHASDIS